jgi:hypothetical protein
METVLKKKRTAYKGSNLFTTDMIVSLMNAIEILQQ